MAGPVTSVHIVKSSHFIITAACSSASAVPLAGLGAKELKAWGVDPATRVPNVHG